MAPVQATRWRLSSAGLRHTRRQSQSFEPLVFDMGKPRMDLTKASALAAELEDHELIGRYRRSR